jgi:flagellar basal-body rod modification protein FlgD
MEKNTATGLENVISKTSTATTTTKATGMKAVGKEEFMKLLLAQLKNQDPLKPLDGTDFAVQLAQFSSLEQLSNLNEELKAQSVNQMTLGYAQSVNMIGKQVVAGSGNTVTANGQSAEINYSLDKDAESVVISVLDQNGKLIKSWEETAKKEGLNKATWECSGAEAGDYTFQVMAMDKLGKPVAADTMQAGVVTAVHFRGNQILATVDGREVPLSSIVEIKQPNNG